METIWWLCQWFKICQYSTPFASFVQSSKSDSTLKKYKCYFKKFEQWCKSCSLQYLPATSATVSIYIGGLIQQGISVAILDSSFYGIKWYHDFYFENNPCSNKLLSLIHEGGKRLLCKPVCKKDPHYARYFTTYYSSFWRS